MIARYAGLSYQAFASSMEGNSTTAAPSTASPSSCSKGVYAATLLAPYRVEVSSSFLLPMQELTTPRTDTPPAFDLSKLALPVLTLPTSANEQQNSMISFGHFLETKMSHVEELAAKGYRSLKSLNGALSQLEVAKDRFVLFLHHGQKGRLSPD